MDRRTLITVVPVVAVAAFAGLTARLLANENPLPPLTHSNSAARALHYFDDARRADPQEYNRSTNEFCRTCKHYQGSGDESRGGCDLFPNNSVAAQGWCSAWIENN